MSPPDMKKLDFKEDLKASGKGATTDVLLKKLKTLFQKLQELVQDETDLRSVDKVKKPLVTDSLMHHKDRGVRAYTACCLAEILRIYAPDAPYTGEELRDIFQFFVIQVCDNLKVASSQVRPLMTSKSRGTQDAQPSVQRITDIPYFTEYSSLLENLANFQSVVLILDVPGGDDLMERYFNGFMEIIRPDMNKSLIRHLAEILSTLIDESASIPSGVMDCLIRQFENYASSPETPSFQLAVDVCNQTAERLQRHILAHYSEVQLNHGRDPSPADLKILAEAHTLLLTMYRHCPALLLNVIPLLEDNLRAVDEIPLRQMSVRTLGAIFGERTKAGATDFARAYPSAWKAWLGRRLDKALLVRLAWVEASRDILIHHPDLRQDLQVDLIDRISDPDEKVRAAICKVIGSLDYETALHHVNEKTIRAVGGRISDKKSVVRVEALAALSRLWNLAYSEIEAGDPEGVRHFAWIPEVMLHGFNNKGTTMETRVQIASTLRNTILPLPAKADDEQAWVDRLLLVASSLDDHAMKGLDRLTGLKGYSRGSSPFQAFIKFCEENNGGVIEGDAKMVKLRLNYVISAISQTLFAEPEKAKKDIEHFAEVNEPRLYKLFGTCADQQTDLKTLIKSRNEFSRRLEQSHSDLLDTFTVILDSASWMIINHSSIPPLIKRLQQSGGRTVDAASHFLYLIGKEGAPMFRNHIDELLIVINDKRNQKMAEVAMQGLAAVCKVDRNCAPTDRKTLERAANMAVDGTPRQAKFGARFLAYSKDTDAPSELVTEILEALHSDSKGRLLSHLSALSELALSSPAAFGERSEEIVAFILDEVMRKESTSGEDEESDEWVDEETLLVLDRAKLVGLRILTHWSFSFGREKDGAKLIQPNLDLLSSILRNDGQVNEETHEGGRARCHLRLRAALCMLKLANVRVFDEALTPYFEQITFIIQDPCYHVRYTFLKKLAEVLPNQRLMPRWNIIPALVAKDPEDDNIALGKSIMLAIVKTASKLGNDRIKRIEMPFARLLLLLTHHPDLSWDASGLKDIARFIELFLDCIATRDNIALLLYIAQKAKTVKDANPPQTVVDEDVDTSEYLYRLSDLAQLIIRNRASVHNWPLQTYPGKVQLPKDSFQNLESPEEAQAIVSKMYLSEDIVRWAQGLGRKQITTAGPIQRRARDTSGESKKRSAPTTKKTPKKRRRPSQSDEESESNESESDLSSDEEGNALGTKQEDEIDDAEKEDEGENVMGRGGKRNAKTKAKKKVSKRKPGKSDEIEVDGESDLTEIDD
ncbi:sister chromatid cohesion protein PDS5, partial [Tremellales sp. Uapishka_1]